MRSLQVLTEEQKDLLSVVSSKHTSRQTQALDVETTKDSVKRMQESMEGHSQSQDSLRNEVEDLKFDLQQAIEKQNVRGAETEETLARLKEDTKDEYSSLRISYKQIQGTLEQQVGELTRKFNKMESKSGGSSGAAGKGATADQIAAMEETAKLLTLLEAACEPLGGPGRRATEPSEYHL